LEEERRLALSLNEWLPRFESLNDYGYEKVTIDENNMYIFWSDYSNIPYTVDNKPIDYNFVKVSLDTEEIKYQVSYAKDITSREDATTFLDATLKEYFPIAYKEKYELNNDYFYLSYTSNDKFVAYSGYNLDFDEDNSVIRLEQNDQKVWEKEYNGYSDIYCINLVSDYLVAIGSKILTNDGDYITFRPVIIILDLEGNIVQTIDNGENSGFSNLIANGDTFIVNSYDEYNQIYDQNGDVSEYEYQEKSVVYRIPPKTDSYKGIIENPNTGASLSLMFIFIIAIVISIILKISSKSKPIKKV